MAINHSRASGCGCNSCARNICGRTGCNSCATTRSGCNTCATTCAGCGCNACATTCAGCGCNACTTARSGCGACAHNGCNCFGLLRGIAGPLNRCGSCANWNFPFYTGPCGPVASCGCGSCATARAVSACDPCNTCGCGTTRTGCDCNTCDPCGCDPCNDCGCDPCGCGTARTGCGCNACDPCNDCGCDHCGCGTTRTGCGCNACDPCNDCGCNTCGCGTARTGCGCNACDPCNDCGCDPCGCGTTRTGCGCNACCDDCCGCKCCNAHRAGASFAGGTPVELACGDAVALSPTFIRSDDFRATPDGVEILRDGSYLIMYTVHIPAKSAVSSRFVLTLNGERITASALDVTTECGCATQGFTMHAMVHAQAGSVLKLVSLNPVSIAQSSASNVFTLSLTRIS